MPPLHAETKNANWLRIMSQREGCTGNEREARVKRGYLIINKCLAQPLCYNVLALYLQYNTRADVTVTTAVAAETVALLRVV